MHLFNEDDEVIGLRLEFSRNNQTRHLVGTMMGQQANRLAEDFPNMAAGAPASEIDRQLVVNLSGVSLSSAHEEGLAGGTPYTTFTLQVGDISVSADDAEGAGESDNAKVTKLESENQRLQELVESLTSSNTTSTEDKKSLQEQLDAKSKELETRTSERDELQTQNDQLQRDLEAATDPSKQPEPDNSNSGDNGSSSAS